MKSMVRFALLLVALIAISGFLLTLAFKTAGDRQAIIVSASLATAVQLTTFGILRLFGKSNLLIGWGVGIMLRGTVLVLYGLFLAKMLGLPLGAALVSFAVFLFVSMLLESLLLAHDR